MPATMTRKQKSRLNKAKHRLKQRRARTKKACVGRARTPAGRRRKARSTKCRYHKRRLPRNRAAVKKARKSTRRRSTTRGRKGARRGARKTRRNPGPDVTKHLKGGGEIQIHREGSSNARVFAYDRSGDLILDDRMTWTKALAFAKRYKTTAALEKKVQASEWGALAENPRRRKKTRRNCGMAMNPRRRKKSRRNAPISGRDLKALRHILRDHKKGRKGRKSRAR